MTAAVPSREHAHDYWLDRLRSQTASPHATVVGVLETVLGELRRASRRDQLDRDEITRQLDYADGVCAALSTVTTESRPHLPVTSARGP